MQMQMQIRCMEEVHGYSLIHWQEDTSLSPMSAKELAKSMLLVLWPELINQIVLLTTVVTAEGYTYKFGGAASS